MIYVWLVVVTIVATLLLPIHTFDWYEREDFMLQSVTNEHAEREIVENYCLIYGWWCFTITLLL